MRTPNHWRRLALPLALAGLTVIAACSKDTADKPQQEAQSEQPAERNLPAPKEMPTVDVISEPTLSDAEKTEVAEIAKDLHKHIAVLASDKFEGRAPATKGEELTVNYLADEFKKLGLQPGATDADGNPSWFQDVPVVEMQIESTPLEIKGKDFEQSLQPLKDMVAFTQRQTPESQLKDSPLVFVGYGIVAPENDWNDYAGLDMQGKTAVILVNDPGYATQDKNLFNGNAMTYYGRWSYKFEEAARQGAAGAIIIHETGAAGYPWEVVSGSWSGAQISLEAADKNADRVAVESWITSDAAKSLFSAAGLDLTEEMDAAKQQGFKPKPLNLTASVDLTSKVRTSNSRNVVAKIEGSKYPEEAIIYTAHWDHLGVNTHADDGDQIFNGAVDNATGTAGLLAMAHQVAKMPQAPERSLVFVAVTAEESGLLGSKYYAANPVIPLGKTVAGINFDAMGVLGPMRDVIVVGYGNSELEKDLEKAASAQGRYLAPEDHPERGYFYRSDHFSLAKKGVPMLYFDSGTDSFEHGREWAQKKGEEYTAEHYHKPGDEYDPQWNLEGAALDLALGLDIGLALANSRDWPNWYKGNEFRAIRDNSSENRK
ncbi:M28 family metallopeptidase [Microbulbifer hydrolyticus]|uniref:M28 family peptidase n=1 Tax=Microbulbifer hydrolyticus TaxID=48074 RepID=A0A6P1TAN1_9GAMM|nr:M28 family metallopeptidase [Microbulbifer hydrolyticus]MBB5210715.1 Zn-dependent M28 family amino/carboxypeptidase [Microbulbifer hydrolyticus]QHQ38831.1 M28 family peptidase [Microbulbifer hydrolyticus]